MRVRVPSRKQVTISSCSLEAQALASGARSREFDSRQLDKGSFCRGTSDSESLGLGEPTSDLGVKWPQKTSNVFCPFDSDSSKVP